MAFKGKEQGKNPVDAAGMVQFWTFETRESLEKFAAVLDANGLAYETWTRGAEKTKGADGVVIAVAESDYSAARRLLLRHRKRRSSADRH